MDNLTPKNHGEEVAVFRHALIGELASAGSIMAHAQRRYAA